MNTTDEASNRRPSRMLIATAVLLAAAVFLVVMSVLEAKELSVLRSRSGFQIAGGDKVFYAPAGNGLCAATTEYIQLFSSGGKCVAKEKVSLADPACAGCSLLGAYYDIGQNTLYALYPDGASRSAQTDGPVSFVSVNETGLITVIMDKSGYKGSVMVYDTDLQPLFRWDAASGYPLSARVSKNDVLCVNCAAETGSALRFFRIDRAAEQAVFAANSELITDFGYLSDGTVCAVSEGRAVLLDTDGRLRGEVSFGDRVLEAWYLQGDFAAVSLVTGKDGGSAQLLTFDSDGTVLGRCQTDRSVLALSGNGDALLALFDGQESTLYSRTLEEEVSYQPEADVWQVFLTADSRALFGGSARALRVDFDR